MPLQRPLPMDTPRFCTIRAAGTLDAAWSERLGGLDVRVSAGPGDPTVELSGQLPDQAALVGVLFSLCNLGLPLISVACRVATPATPATLAAGASAAVEPEGTGAGPKTGPPSLGGGAERRGGAPAEMAVAVAVRMGGKLHGDS